MATQEVVLALLLCYLRFHSVSSFPQSLYVTPTNISVPNNLPANLLPNLTAPTPPMDLSIRLDFNSSIKLNPIQVLLCTVESMSFLANLPWTFIIQASMSMAADDGSTEVFLDRYPHSGDSKLQVRYAVLGLYQAGMAIAKDNKYTQLEILLYVEELKVGWLALRPGSKQLLRNLDGNHLVPLNPFDMYNTTTAVMANSGTVFDPHEKRLVINYRMDGVRIKAVDVFTAILDGFAIAAVHNNEDVDAYIPAARSASGDVVLSTWEEGKKGNPLMTWLRLKRALLLIWDVVIIGDKPKFEGLAFDLLYDGQEIGGGRILKFDRGGQSTERNAVNK